jgi:hypothetical protein
MIIIRYLDTHIDTLIGYSFLIVCKFWINITENITRIFFLTGFKNLQEFFFNIPLKKKDESRRFANLLC